MMNLLLILVTAGYGGLLLRFFLRLKKSGGIWEPSLQSYPLPNVSVIVAARNEERTISHLLDALSQQSYPQELLEIIIVNDRSTDATAEKIKAYTRTCPNIRMITVTSVPPQWSPKKWALNTGIIQSSGEVILQTDADCRPVPRWVETMVSYFQVPQTGFVSGSSPLFEKDRFIDRLFCLDSVAQDGFSAGGAEAGVILSCTGRNMGYRRQVFDEVKGYDGIHDYLSGDDDLMLQKIASQTDWKVKFILHPDALVFSLIPESAAGFVRQRLRFASKGLAYYRLPSTPGLRMVLPLLYVANISVLAGFVMTIVTGNGMWMGPWCIKFAAEALYTRYIFHRLKLKWHFPVFAFMSFIHPFYVVLFGTLGPLLNIRWKE